LNLNGFLKRKGRKHIIPSMEEAKEMEMLFDKIESEKFSKEFEESLREVERLKKS